MRYLIAAAMVTVVASSPALANNFLNGNDLYALCEDHTAASDGMASGYIGAAADSTADYDVRVCFPTRMTMSQARDVVCKYLDDHPEDRHFTAFSLSMRALTQAWPCS